MSVYNPKKTNLFATVTLMCTIGITIAAFTWLHVEPSVSNRPAVTTKMSLEEKVQLLNSQLERQQVMISDLQTRVKNLESFDIY